ncbi:MAG: MATE family efflux transporter [Firmicutes bacterium]|nr:MATE family efflux transporter [Bacillota bacterium]
MKSQTDPKVQWPDEEIRPSREEAQMETGDIEIDDEEIKREVKHLATPALIEMVLISFVGVADMIMVGRLGPAAIAAVGLTNQPVFFAHGVFQALNVGTTALVARFFGADQRKDAQDTAKQSLAITIFMGTLVGILGYLATPWVIKAMGAEPEVLPLGISYMRIVCLGFAFNAVSMVCSSVLRGAGDTRIPMIVNLTANLVNVTGNYLLIYGHFGFPRLGIAGAALATAFSRVVACIIFLYVLFAKKSVIGIGLKGGYRPDRNLLGRVFNIGLPAAIEQFIFRGGQLIFVRMVSGFGTSVFAAHQIGVNILSLSFMPGQAFGIAATTLVGQGLGANRPQLAERSALVARRLGMIFSTTIALLMFVFGKYIAALYTNDPDVIVKTAMVLKIIGVVQPAQSTQFILGGGLRGAGDTRWPLYSTFLGIWVMRVIAGYLFGVVLGLGLLGAWMGMALDQLTRASVISYRFRKGGWKELSV